MFVFPVPKISQVMMKWCRRASHLGRFTLWHNGRRAKQPDLMHAPGVEHIFQRQWRTVLKNMKAQSKVKFHSGCFTSQTFAIWTLWKIQQTQIDSRPSTNCWNMYPLRTFSKRLLRWTLYEDRIAGPQQTFERLTLRTHESPRELARQSEAKRKQAPQSEANLCQHKCNPKKSLINCTGHPIMYRTPNWN